MDSPADNIDVNKAAVDGEVKSKIDGDVKSKIDEPVVKRQRRLTPPWANLPEGCDSYSRRPAWADRAGYGCYRG